MDRVAIVIPVYKSYLSGIEDVSYRQLWNILGNYPIYLVAPENLDITCYNDIAEKNVKRFPKFNFENIESYSKLCMSTSFYESFLEYEYILIYQLDAFVFSDRLYEFCQMGYDYIGAPVPGSTWDELPFYVGNGGFSLRNTYKCYEVCNKKQSILELFEIEFGSQRLANLDKREDCFFGYCGYNGDIDFSVANLDVAFKFSVEFNINAVYQRINKKLPFGCHRWNTYRFSDWWSIISKFGYILDDCIIEEHKGLYQWHEYRVLMHEIENNTMDEPISDAITKLIGLGGVSIWGYGNDGKKIKNYLEKFKVNVCKIYDKNKYEGVETVYPIMENIVNSGETVLITTTKYDDKIIKECNHIGLSNGTRIIGWRYLSSDICKIVGIYRTGEVISGL